ncbi:DUF4174 domain-containing protein [Rhizobium sp. XQZ8]|uniref:DUF4174 domain-containing protein n=1 Tax=Rhizobium populisoli TaxID=2859785 RepID=UPI001CA47D3E|nr:DUF4174 domain-containing protein [Rhizobium populisoli]MBW6425320.1 DUF4174 domain-containing protein [Rhizobium populisoli]
MRDLFDDKGPEWILLVICDDHETLMQQRDDLAPYQQHFADRDIVVVTVEPGDAKVAHGDRNCELTASELIRKYDLTPAQVSYVLIDKQDCVKWAAPTACGIKDVVSAVDEMPRHDAENATRGPAPSDRKPVASFRH